MNIYLIPYTWTRHFAVGLFCATAGVLAWWFVLSWVILISPSWAIGWDGAVWLGTLAAVISGTSLLAEGSLRRSPFVWRVASTALAATLSAGITIVLFFIWTQLAPSVLGALIPSAARDLMDEALVSLKYRMVVFVLTGLAIGMATTIARKLASFLSHIGAGLAAGLASAMVWHVVGSTTFMFGNKDLYAASMLSSLTMGLIFGLFSWEIPDRLYAGWVRVITTSRYGRRIPIDGLDGKPRERFVGHYPRGLDLFMPANEGVMELHVSFLVDEDQSYRVRGMTLQPTRVTRFLEKINLRYDPALPAPKEAELSSGDRIYMGPEGNQTVLEFIMLPREEQ